MTHAATAQPLQTLTLGGGCFWCLDAVYRRVRGVVAVESGYCNGHVPQPSYEQVCRGDTGHAEVVRLQFDPAQVSARELLEIFFCIHDPTTPNRQGNDVGPQYRSGVYFEDPQHAELARDIIHTLERDGGLGAPVVTEVLPLHSGFDTTRPLQLILQHPARADLDRALVLKPRFARRRCRVRSPRPRAHDAGRGAYQA